MMVSTNNYLQSDKQSTEPNEETGGETGGQVLGQPFVTEEITTTSDAEPTITSITESLQQNLLLQIIDELTATRNDFRSLLQGFDSKIKYDASKEHIIDTLHKELQTYREGLHFKIMRPLLFDLIEMHDDLTNLLKYHRNAESESDMASRLLKSLASFQDTIESILEKHGVVTFNEPGDQFLPQRQRAIRAETTDDPSKDRLVFEHLRKGFEYDGKVLRPESVSLYKFTTPTSIEDSPKEV